MSSLEQTCEYHGRMSELPCLLWKEDMVILRGIYFRAVSAVEKQDVSTWREILHPFYVEIEKKITKNSIGPDQASGLDFEFFQVRGNTGGQRINLPGTVDQLKFLLIMRW